MTQLFVQTVPRHASWLLVGPPAATSLVPQQDITVTFSDSSSVVVPAGVPAALPGGGTTWDRTQQVVVGYVVPGSGTLLACPEAQLAGLATDYAPLVCVLSDSVQVYQPQQPDGTAIRAGAWSGGAVLQPLTLTFNSAPGAGKGWSGWPPATGWQNAGFDDTSWENIAGQPSPWDGGIPAGTSWVCPAYLASNGVTLGAWAFRAVFNLSSLRVVSSATLQIRGDNQIVNVWINGTLIYSGPDYTGFPPLQTVSIAPSLLTLGNNVLAIQVHDDNWPTGVDYQLSITGWT